MGNCCGSKDRIYAPMEESINKSRIRRMKYSEVKELIDNQFEVCIKNNNNARNSSGLENRIHKINDESSIEMINQYFIDENEEIHTIFFIDMFNKLSFMKCKYKTLFVFFSLFKNENKIKNFYSIINLINQEGPIYYIRFFDKLKLYFQINLFIQEEIVYRTTDEETIKQDAIHRIKNSITDDNLTYFINHILTDFDEYKMINSDNIKGYEMTLDDFYYIFKNKLEVFDIFGLREYFYSFLKKSKNHLQY